MKKSTKIRLI